MDSGVAILCQNHESSGSISTADFDRDCVVATLANFANAAGVSIRELQTSVHLQIQATVATQKKPVLMTLDDYLRLFELLIIDDQIARPTDHKLLEASLRYLQRISDQEAPIFDNKSSYRFIHKKDKGQKPTANDLRRVDIQTGDGQPREFLSRLTIERNSWKANVVSLLKLLYARTKNMNGLINSLSLAQIRMVLNSYGKEELDRVTKSFSIANLGYYPIGVVEQDKVLDRLWAIIKLVLPVTAQYYLSFFPLFIANRFEIPTRTYNAFEMFASTAGVSVNQLNLRGHGNVSIPGIHFGADNFNATLSLNQFFEEYHVWRKEHRRIMMGPGPADNASAFCTSMSAANDITFETWRDSVVTTAQKSKAA